jgi:hypothetical protein
MKRLIWVILLLSVMASLFGETLVIENRMVHPLTDVEVRLQGINSSHATRFIRSIEKNKTKTISITKAHSGDYHYVLSFRCNGQQFTAAFGYGPGPSKLHVTVGIGVALQAGEVVQDKASNNTPVLLYRYE